ncbi:hypothetical protein GCM10010166_15540 [Couchioplanes caeruleus subsp. azureus]|nr:hypothetical protein GCM10010166_15540 [Couchioplanes caeruleus subsp. azureus]
MPDGDDVILPAAGPAAPAFVPSPRPPDAAEMFPGAPLGVPAPPAAPPEPPPGPRGRRGLLWAGGVLALVAALAVAGGVVHVAQREAPGTPAGAAAEPSGPQTAKEWVDAILLYQAQALLTGDEKAWLEPVDPGRPGLRTRYRTMFRSLRSLGVRHFEHLTTDVYDEDEDTFKADVRIRYCLTGDLCDSAPVLPEALQELSLAWHDDLPLVTSVASTKSDDDLLPAPWEETELIAAQGKRLTLVAAPGERKYLERLLPVAERAAAVVDRFAGMVGNLQRHYRIYLAGPRQWKTWYGGAQGTAWVGYTQTITPTMTDVVLNMAELKDDPELLALTIQHELAHVATVGGVDLSASGWSGMWLEEGIAEYIGWYPKPATASWSRQSVRDAVHGSGRPESVALSALPDDAGGEETDAFYGLGHFAASCFAAKYGERALMTFVRLYLREDKDLDRASGEAFGKPFAAVDKACLTWIRRKA